MPSKHAEVKRIRMTDDQVKQFISKFCKEHDLHGKERADFLERHAATRLAALDRYARKQKAPKKHAAPKAAKKAPKAKAKKAA